jgi:hypothetical protein
MTEGLEADLADLVAERGRGALCDPLAYARELRAAAGLAPEVARPVSRRAAGAAVVGVLDAAHQGFDAVVAKLPGDVGALLTWLRPLWWIARGWAVVQLVDMYGGRSRMNVVPDLHGLGWLLCLLAIAGSVAVGLGASWPGGATRGALARLVLLALNLFAVVVTPMAVSQVVDGVNQRYDRGYARGFANGLRAEESDPGTNRAGMYVDGTWVSNIYPYDAKGRPLVGVQLFDQVGKPLDVITQPEYVDDIESPDENRPRIYYPWTNGATQVLNVFPIPSRVQDDEEPSPTAFSEKVRPAITPFPLARVPAVSLPGIEPGRQRSGAR